MHLWGYCNIWIW